MSPSVRAGPSIVTTEDPPTLPGSDRPGFRRAVLRIDPGDRRPYRPSDWADSLVVIETGELDLETASGVRHTCRAGDVLWLAGLPLRSLVNRGAVPVVITVVRRR